MFKGLQVFSYYKSHSDYFIWNKELFVKMQLGRNVLNVDFQCQRFIGFFKRKREINKDLAIISGVGLLEELLIILNMTFKDDIQNNFKLKSEKLVHAIMWMSLRNIMLSERSRSRRNTLYTYINTDIYMRSPE